MMRAIRMLLVGALLAWSSLGFAQGSDLERAKASFKAGANAYAAGDYPAAIQALETAYELTPLPAIAFSLAQAERKQYFTSQDVSHLRRAVELFRRYLDQEPRGARRQDARTALGQLEPLLARESSSKPDVVKSQTRPTRLMIVSDTPGALISLDGGTHTTSPLIREVTAGEHRARVQAPGFVDVERPVTAVAGELVLTEIRLVEKPSSLTVWAPRGADVYVDGVYIAEAAGPVVVALAPGRHQLAVARKGRRLVRRDLELSRGRAHSEYVTLEATSQRTLSQVLLVAGGAALGGSLILSALAVSSENSAEDFLAAQGKRELGPAELVAYEGSLAERNRYRAAAGASLTGALGLLVTGLFLHELDNPGAIGPSSRSKPMQQSASFALVPACGAGQLG